MDIAVRQPELNDLEKALIDHYQRGFPLASAPFEAMAAKLGAPVEEIEAALNRLIDLKVVSRLGAVVSPHRAGWSTLAALSVPEARLEAVADLVNGYDEVNHNYEREHDYNLWFVITAADRQAVQSVICSIEERTGLNVLDLPMEEAFHIDLGFGLKWN